MSETPANPQAEPSTTPVARPAAPPTPAVSGEEGAEPLSEMAEAMREAPLTVRTLLEAGVHFGHQTRRWNPRMKPYLFGERDGIHIIDLDATLPRFQRALDFLKETAAAGGKVLFVGTKRQAAGPVKTEALRAKQFYVSQRWLGGMLTNFRTVKKSIERYKEMLAVRDDEERYTELTKKDRARLNREIDKYTRSLEGMREMTRLPDALFVIDVSAEHIAVDEAQRLGIPIVAVVDSNCDPEGIDFVVPGNDDAIRAIHLYCSQAADACLAGDRVHQERLQAQQAAEKERKPEGEAAPRSGRRVVEIKQPPRRGRGEERRARRAREEMEALEAPEAPVEGAAAPPGGPAAKAAPPAEAAKAPAGEAAKPGAGEAEAGGAPAGEKQEQE